MRGYANNRSAEEVEENYLYSKTWSNSIIEIKKPIKKKII